MEIGTVRREFRVDEAVWVGLVVKHDVKGNEEVGLPGIREAEQEESGIGRAAHVRPKAEKSRAGWLFRTEGGGGG